MKNQKPFDLSAFVALLLLIVLVGLATAARPAALGETPAAGELRILGKDGAPVGACPLKHTDVKADISGYVGRVRVRQTFHNPTRRTIEAVYVFPLPPESAVDEMTMIVGHRRIVGRIKPREQARRIYETAKRAGHVAGLLDQERPNIFTQSVANIAPGAEVVIEIGYVETLKYEDGFFEWVFPMVVGPRYVPGAPVGRQGTGRLPDTDRVPDASRISPPVARPPARAGHDIAVAIRLDAGMPLFDIESPSHAVDVVPDPADPNRAIVRLRDQATIPNKDFVLRYRTATDRVGDAFLVHQDRRGSFFTLVLQPPRRVAPGQAVPKEMIFVIDRSGSMEGFPIGKAKETMRLCIQGMNPRDTFNLLSFAGGTGRCFERPVPNTPENRAVALRYLSDLYGSGGTEMMPAIEEALAGHADPDRLRVVCFMTDGYIGNDFEIIDAIRKHAGTTRVFAFGIGTSVNRFLLDGMAHAGRGAVEYVTLESRGDEAARRFHERIQSPVLTDIAVDWGGLPVFDVYPSAFPDLFSARPLMIHGRLRARRAGGAITLRGRTAEGPFERRVHIRSAQAGDRHGAIAALWARAKVTDLMRQDMRGLQSGTFPEPLKRQITDLGVAYRLMTQFTSFVAVEERVITKGGRPATIAVPVEIPEGVSYRGAVGDGALAARGGDPLLQVEAPDDAMQVVALLPGGEVKPLLRNPVNGKWEARFDIPTYVEEGDYRVTVIVVRRDGARRTLVLRYAVDQTAPMGAGRAQMLRAGAPMLRLELDASADTARVVALLPWGEKALLRPSTLNGDHFAALVPVPPAQAGKAQQVVFVLTDRAHNRTTITMDLSDRTGEQP